MSYLREALKKYSSKLSFDTRWQKEKEDFRELGFTIPNLSKELVLWYDSLPEFNCISIPWSVEDIHVTRRDSLLANMGGFRFVPRQKDGIWEDMKKFWLHVWKGI